VSGDVQDTQSGAPHTQVRSGSLIPIPFRTGPCMRYHNFTLPYTHTTHNTHTHHSFSHSGGVLCGVGRDSHGKNLLVLWNTSQVTHSGEVSVLTKAHTEANIERMRIAAFDDSR